MKTDDERTTYAHTTRPLNVVYFGLSGAFSVPPLEALIEAGFSIRAIVLPTLPSSSNGATTPPFTQYIQPSPPPLSNRRSLPLLTTNSTRTIVQIAAKYTIPVLEVARLRDPATSAMIASFKPDVLSVACFSRRIPREIRDIPRLGCLNVHPSLLPSNRGPDPLFWTFRRGDASTGITIHQMDEGLDTGPIVLQERIDVPEGISETALEKQCATVGGSLLVRAIRGLDAGSIIPAPQNETLASTYPLPTVDDFSITPDCSARRAFTFACGIAARTQPIYIISPGHIFRLISPLGYEANETIGAPFSLDGDLLSLQCAPGVFRARIERV